MTDDMLTYDKFCLTSVVQKYWGRNLPDPLLISMITTCVHQDQAVRPFHKVTSVNFPTKFPRDNVMDNKLLKVYILYCHGGKLMFLNQIKRIK